MSRKTFIAFVAAALALKISLYVFAVCHAPDSKFRTDTAVYLPTGIALAEEGRFGLWRNGDFIYEFYRTPGYPLFLGLTHKWLRISLDGVLAVQVLLTCIAAFFTYKTAQLIHEPLAPLSALVVLFDPPSTVYSLMLLGESLYLCFISVFMFAFVRYLKTHKIRDVFFAALILAASIYIRPVGYYLPFWISLWAAGYLFRRLRARAIVHAILISAIAFMCVLPWHFRNEDLFGEFRFSTISEATLKTGGLWRSYEDNEDEKSRHLPAAAYYMNAVSRSLLSLFTRPVSLKYFGSENLKRAAKVMSYLWIGFWMAGFLLGAARSSGHPAFLFLLWVVAYFAATAVVGTLWGADARLRIPMVPFIAVICSYGWNTIMEKRPTPGKDSKRMSAQGPLSLL